MRGLRHGVVLSWVGCAAEVPEVQEGMEPDEHSNLEPGKSGVTVGVENATDQG